MQRDRRQFLASVGALAAATACDEPANPAAPKPSEPAPDRSPEPAPWAAPGTLDSLAFPGGVRAGDATSDGAILSVRTTEPTIDLLVMVAAADGWEEVARHDGLTPVEGNVQFELEALASDSAYAAVFLAGDRRSATVRFRTAIPSGGWRKVVFAATSCLGSADPSWASLAEIASFDPDFTLLLGDTVYADGSLTAEDYRAEWERAFANESLQALFARSSLIATWDDHEVANNWVRSEGDLLHTAVTDEQLATATTVFRDALPMRVGPGGNGLWRKLGWGVVDVFVLDSRGERSKGKIVSDEQLAWLQEELHASEAAFKIIMASVHVTDHYDLMSTGAADDRWQGYPAQRDALIAAIVEVAGVFVVTGDMHYGGVQRIDPEGGPAADRWEIAAGPAGSSLFPLSAVAQIGGDGVPAQYDAVIEDWTSCLFVADPGLGTLTVQFIGNDGGIRAERTLSA